MDVPPGREREMLDAFHDTFVPEAVKHEGYIRVKMLKRRTFFRARRPPRTTTASSSSSRARSCGRSGSRRPGHQRVWPLVERTMTTQKDYPVVLYDEV